MKSVQLLAAITLLCAATGALAASDNDWLMQPKPVSQTSAPTPGAASGDTKGDTGNNSAIMP